MWWRKPPETQEELMRKIASAPKIDSENASENAKCAGTDASEKTL
jgi:hypothetical protein